MDTENTPRSKASQDTSCAKSTVEPFKGVPLDMLCNVLEIQRMLSVADEPWDKLLSEGLPILVRAGNAKIGFTTEVIEWMKTRPKMPMAASALRKKRQRRRKTK